MKVEMGESLCYSWLRHVKRCQIAQTDWRASPSWRIVNVEELEALERAYDTFYREKYGFDLFRGNSLQQFLVQAKADVLGLSLAEPTQSVYAIDVEFHEDEHGGKEATAGGIVKNFIRTMLSLYAYFSLKNGEVIFASPDAKPDVAVTLAPMVRELNEFTAQLGLSFRMRLITGKDFEAEILQPVVDAGDETTDTSELFLHGVQLYKLFGRSAHKTSAPHPPSSHHLSFHRKAPDIQNDKYKGVKVGKLAKTVLRQLIESGILPSDIIEAMQTAEYSKQEFDLQYPLLVKDGSKFKSSQYYKTPISLGSTRYYMCSQWYEKPTNNDRAYLLAWLSKWL
jgi:hypothetical protein